jgi:hypothetical protein
MKRLFAILASLVALPAAAQALREDTASQIRHIGPFVDTDGAVLPSLTIDAADVRVAKNGANIVAKNSGGCTYDEVGMYACTFDATDTSDAGDFLVTVAETGALVVRHRFTVVPAAVYDALNLSGVAGPKYLFGIIDSGTLQSISGTTAVLRSALSVEDDWAYGATIVLTSGACAGSYSSISDFVGSTDTATVPSWVGCASPSGTPDYEIFPTIAQAGLAASTIRDAIGMAAPTYDTDMAARSAEADVIAGFVDDIGVAGAGLTVLATAAALAITDSVADAIKLKTDQMNFGVTGQIDANVESVNAFEVLGEGTAALPWNGE